MPTPPDRRETHFTPLRGIFEPSAVQQLPDGRFLVVDDEKEFPFSAFALDADARMVGDPVPMAAPEKLNDLEGLTLGPDGRVYAITSHSRDGDGEVKKSRRRLVRFRVVGDAITDFATFEDLLPALVDAHPALAAAAKVDDVKDEGGLNVEALEMAPDGAGLLVGLRGPLIDGQAVVAAIARPDALFDSEGTMLDALFDRRPKPELTLRRVALDGQGIRALAWIPALASYLVVSGPLSRARQAFGLWRWNGRDDVAHRVAIAGAEGLARTEGIAAARVGGRDGVLLVSDDGDRAAGRCAGHLWADIAALRSAP